MELAKLGVVDVDAGMLMIGDPAYTLPDSGSCRTPVARDWKRFCAAIDRQVGKSRLSSAQPFGTGTALVVCTPHGDGEYPVLAELDSAGNVRRLIIDLDPHAESDLDDGLY